MATSAPVSSSTSPWSSPWSIRGGSVIDLTTEADSKEETSKDHKTIRQPSIMKDAILLRHGSGHSLLNHRLVRLRGRLFTDLIQVVVVCDDVLALFGNETRTVLERMDKALAQRLERHLLTAVEAITGHSYICMDQAGTLEWLKHVSMTCAEGVNTSMRDVKERVGLVELVSEWFTHGKAEMEHWREMRNVHNMVTATPQ